MAERQHVSSNDIDMAAFNNWMSEFKVSSRYSKPLSRQDRHYFDASVYTSFRKETSHFYYKFVTIVKNIF